METKRSKKGRKQRPVQHHPWDEVSLPGAGTGPTEQPTILVINQVNVDAAAKRQISNETNTTNTKTAEKEENTTTSETETEETKIPETAESNYLNTAQQLQPQPQSDPEPTVVEPSTPSSDVNVLDIESHNLIEDFNPYDTPDESVSIKELPPLEDELTQGTSKIETDVNARSIIEVEPAGVKIKQAVATDVSTQQSVKAETHLAEVPVENSVAETPSTKAEEVEVVVEEAVLPADETAPVLEVPEAVRQTAEDLVNEIERQVIETLASQQEALQNVVDTAEPHIETETPTQKLPAEAAAVEEETLTERVNAQLTELTSILKSRPQTEIAVNLTDSAEATTANKSVHSADLKVVEVPTPKTASEVEERKLFLDSLPQIEQKRAGGADEQEANRLSADCKREYYQSLKKYLLQSSQERPPVPLQTYRWEDLRRAKERGGYPWTHLYKRPLGPDEEPEIVLLLRKSQELRFTSESPKSLKKVRYDEQVLVKETERYIQDLSDDDDDHTDIAQDSQEDVSVEQAENEYTECQSLRSDCISCVSDSVLAVGQSKPRKTSRLAHIRGLIKRRRSGRTHEDAQSLPGTSANTSCHSSVHDLAPPPGPLVPNTTKSPEHKPPHCFPIMKKLKSLADRQKKRLNIRRIALKKDEKIVLGEETKILKLKSSPKCDRGEIPHFIEKQDSDDVLELVEYDESPSRKRNRNEMHEQDDAPTTSSSIVQPDEVIELPAANTVESKSEIETAVEEKIELKQENAAVESAPVATNSNNAEAVTTPEPEPATDGNGAPPKKTPRLRREHVYEEIGQGEPAHNNHIINLDAVDEIKKSLVRQDDLTAADIEAANKSLPLDRMGSSEEEQIANAAAAAAAAEGGSSKSNLLLAPISSIDSTSSDEDRLKTQQLSPVAEESDAASVTEAEREKQQQDLKPSIKKEASPAPSDKKVTFSHVEDEAEPHREDIELPEEVREAASNRNKWKNISDHEYEPIGVTPVGEATNSFAKESSPAPGATAQLLNGASNKRSMEVNLQQVHAEITVDANEDLEPTTESHEELEDLPAEENRKKGFMASAQDRAHRMQDGLKNQAGKIRTKLRSQPKKPVSGSPKAKERRRFKAPEFSKIKMPELKRPDMSKFKEIKRPEFTKFNKPDMSKFKFPEKFATIKLGRSKSFKENEPTTPEEGQETAERPETAPAEPPQPQKKLFDFNFGTYPRAFRKKKKPEEPVPSSLATEVPSVIPSTETQPSFESSNSPQGDRGPGPVRSRWADKFSDVSYNDSEGSRYRRYGSELESFDRESSLERRMKDDLEDTADTSSEVHHDMGILGGVADSKQFAEFDEENRAIHEISNLRSREFKRRPIVHQDSDLRSEDSKEAEGWTEKEIQKNKLLRKAELEAEASYYKYRIGTPQDAISTASSGKKVVMEEIDDDEFFLRKRGISEDNIQLRQYISEAIREGYEMPNALKLVGQTSEDQMAYGENDVPPPKPRRLHKNYRPEYGDSQEFQRSDYGDDYSMSQNGSDYLGGSMPKRPLRKGRSRSKYSMDSQDIPMADEGSSVHYFEDDEEYLRPPTRSKEATNGLNNFNFADKEAYGSAQFEVDEDVPKPQPPRRQKKRGARDGASLEKDSAAFINGFGGRSVSNTHLQPQENVIVYRTEHEYHIPLATPERYTDGASGSSRKSHSASRYDEDDRTSHGADSLALDAQTKPGYEEEVVEKIQHEKYVIDILENDGYAVVRKEQVPKPTPPVRRKKFTRSPGERFATLPSAFTKRGTPPPERPPPPQGYTPSLDSPIPPRPKSAASLDAKPNYEEDDYEEPEALERPESPRNLQSGEVINKMKFRPLPPPPRPPRDKRSRGTSGADDRYEGDSEPIATSSTADSYEQNPDFEVEVSTQTDPLPDDFVCEEFEITEDMKVIEPRRTTGGKTLEDLLKEDQQNEKDVAPQLTEDEQLARGLQRFRDANQRSASERSRASSEAERSKSLSRPQTPSAILIERRVSTPAPSPTEEATVEAALIVRPISAADLEDDELRREEEELRREGLLSDSSVQSKSDVETAGEEEESNIVLSDYAQSSIDLDTEVEKLQLGSDSKVYDEEVERTLRDSEYDEEDEAEKYSNQFDEEDTVDDDKWDNDQKLLDKQLEEAFEKEFQEQMEKELQQEMETELKRTKRETSFEYDDEFKSHDEKISSSEILTEEAEPAKEPVLESTVLKETATEHKTQPKASDEADRITEEYIAEEPEQPPQPPPRRKSTTVIDSLLADALAIAEQSAKEVAPQTSISAQEQPSLSAQLPSRLGDLEVERLRVHALQAGQIMVSQLHGSQISADELECKSGNLVVQNIELPPGFIEDIVERVRSTDHRAPLLTAETQTSRQPSIEPLAPERVSPAKEVEPPQKPPRQSKASESTATSEVEQHSNLDEQTQTDAAMLPLPPPPPVYPSVEYLQSLAPLAFYNLQRGAEAEQADTERKAPHKLRRRQLQRRHRPQEPTENDEADVLISSSDLEDQQLVERARSRRSRTRSGTQPPFSSDDEPKTVAQAGRQFISACSLELVNIINQLTNYVRGGAVEPNQAAELQARHIPALMVLFIIITFGLLVYLLTGRNVHTHHWDYFNPPGNEGRQT